MAPRKRSFEEATQTDFAEEVAKPDDRSRPAKMAKMATAAAPTPKPLPQPEEIEKIKEPEEPSVLSTPPPFPTASSLGPGAAAAPRHSPPPDPPGILGANVATIAIATTATPAAAASSPKKPASRLPSSTRFGANSTRVPASPVGRTKFPASPTSSSSSSTFPSSSFPTVPSSRPAHVKPTKTAAPTTQIGVPRRGHDYYAYPPPAAPRREAESGRSTTATATAALRRSTGAEAPNIVVPGPAAAIGTNAATRAATRATTRAATRAATAKATAAAPPHRDPERVGAIALVLARFREDAVTRSCMLRGLALMALGFFFIVIHQNVAAITPGAKILPHDVTLESSKGASTSPLIAPAPVQAKIIAATTPPVASHTTEQPHEGIKSPPTSVGVVTGASRVKYSDVVDTPAVRSSPSANNVVNTFESVPAKVDTVTSPPVASSWSWPWSRSSHSKEQPQDDGIKSSPTPVDVDSGKSWFKHSATPAAQPSPPANKATTSNETDPVDGEALGTADRPRIARSHLLESVLAMASEAEVAAEALIEMIRRSPSLLIEFLSSLSGLKMLNLAGAACTVLLTTYQGFTGRRVPRAIPWFFRAMALTLSKEYLLWTGIVATFPVTLVCFHVGPFLAANLFGLRLPWHYDLELKALTAALAGTVWAHGLESRASVISHLRLWHATIMYLAKCFPLPVAMSVLTSWFIVTRLTNLVCRISSWVALALGKAMAAIWWSAPAPAPAPTPAPTPARVGRRAVPPPLSTGRRLKRRN